MNKWIYVRITVLAVAAILAIIVGPVKEHANPPIDAGSLALIGLGSIFAIPFVIAIQRMSKFSASTWTLPSWKNNPFSFKQPLNLFHFAAYFSLVGGFVSFVLTYFNSSLFVYDASVPLVVGTGVLLGVKLSSLFFSTN